MEGFSGIFWSIWKEYNTRISGRKALTALAGLELCKFHLISLLKRREEFAFLVTLLTDVGGCVR